MDENEIRRTPERHINTVTIEGRVCAAPNVVRHEDPPIAYIRIAHHNDYVKKRTNEYVEKVDYISIVARGKLVDIAANVVKGQLISVKGFLTQQEEDFKDRSGTRIIRDRVAVDAELIRMYDRPGSFANASEGVSDEVNGNVKV